PEVYGPARVPAGRPGSALRSDLERAREQLAARFVVKRDDQALLHFAQLHRGLVARGLAGRRMAASGDLDRNHRDLRAPAVLVERRDAELEIGDVLRPARNHGHAIQRDQDGDRQLERAAPALLRLAELDLHGLRGGRIAEEERALDLHRDLALPREVEEAL